VIEQAKKPVEIVKDIMRVIEALNHLKDVDTILDRILLEARRLTNCDAGSIFLVQADTLRFSYVHNDTLFGKCDVCKHVYADFSVPINEKSLVGYAAMTGKALRIDDAYALPEGLPYTFNQSFDRETGYHTQSILTLPLKTVRNKTVGVMQLINAKNEEGRTVPFEGPNVQYAPLFANHASVAIERGIMTRELILRMIKMAEMRDPSETGGHVMRVGSYAAEIYHKLAVSRGVDELECKRIKDMLRLAAMLHDVGKVGIPDKILKKPGKLSEEEFATMRWHTVYGAALFAHATSDLDAMSAEIALNHHERWDGGGYPGSLCDNLAEADELCRKPKQGEDIPLFARITALADVFDALSSKRTYKPAFDEGRVFDIIREQRGRHFDPEVVDVFFAIIDVIRAIQHKYQG
jgi:response regulator RpfG family c-di-GMP phosphodiesterase